MRKLHIIFLIQLFLVCNVLIHAQNVIIENKQMRLEVSPTGKAISLLHKPTGQECLVTDAEIPLCALTEYRPYDNELFLTYPAKARTFGSDTIYRIGDELKVGFEEIAYTATITLDITDSYIGFRLTHLEYVVEDIGIKRQTEIDEFTLLQLPVKHREYFGEWLNVVWDKDVVVNLLATDMYAKIDSYRNKYYNQLYAGMENSVKLMNVGAALITTTPDEILNCIEQVEIDYNLPLGVQSRRSKEYAYSYYELRDVTVQNIDEHIRYAKEGGFRTIVLYYPDFSHAMGHFPFNDKYPNGMEDLKTITGKIKKAGMIPGFHIHYNKAARNDTYVSPVPDARLNLVRIFTLTDAIDKTATVITVEENPEGCTLEDDRKLLKIGNELVSYESYTTTPPYQFTGCKRGELGSTIKEVEKGFKFGLLDVDTWPLFIRFDQNTSIQQEVAEKIGQIYAEAGFEFVYFDGAEDVPFPYWHNVSKSQLIVYNELKPTPLFSEGALKSHFGWHILTRGNAFDLFRPEDVRTATKRYTAAAAKYIAQDFTSINFGWNDYLAPNDQTIGMQPDMYEYICSRGAAWDCPIALMGKLNELNAHPRTKDNLEVVRNWEEARINNWITVEQKEQLQNLDQEHILFMNETGKPELLPYQQIHNPANQPDNLRAFVFTRKSKTWIVYWHPRGEGQLKLQLDNKKVRLHDKPGKTIKAKQSGTEIIVPVDKRRYLELDCSEQEAISILETATLL